MTALLLLLVLAVVTAPLSAVGQPAKLPRVATLGSEPTPVWDVFERRLSQLGYVDGRTVVRERRWSRGFAERVPGLLAELLAAEPDLVITSMLPPPPRVHPTPCPPILAIGVADAYGTCRIVPVARMSLAASATELSTTHLRLATSAVPAATRLTVVTDSAQPFLVEYVRGLQRAAASGHVGLVVLDVTAEPDPVALITRHAPDALIIAPAFGDPHVRKQLVHYATRRRIPVVGSHLADGVLIAADYDWVDLGRRAADFVDQLLKGAKPTDLGVDAPIKLGVIVDRRAAVAVGLSLPESLLSQADQVLD